jgi:DNA polymerase I
VFDSKAYFIPTISPDQMLRGAMYNHEVVVADFKRAARIAQLDHWEQTATIYRILPQSGGNMSVDYAVNWLGMNAEKYDLAAVDTETYGVGKRSALDQYSCKLHAIGISFCPTNEALSFLADGSLGVSDTRKLSEAFQRIMHNPYLTKCYQNQNYDIQVLKRYDFQHIGPSIDTLVLSHLTDPETDHDLASIAQQYLDTDPWKVEYRQLEKKGENSLTSLLYYNGRDALATQQLCQPLMNEIIDRGQQHIAHMEMKMSNIAGYMGEVGIPIDPEKVKEIDIKLSTNVDESLAFMRSELSWPEFDPKKPSHRYNVIYDRLKLPVKYYTKKKGLPSTGRVALIEYLSQPLVRAMLRFDENAKLKSTFVTKLPTMVDDNWRLHPHWNSTGTKGSRWSSSDPNFQNWRKWLREIVTTKPGRVLVGADSKAIEYRIIVALAGCRPLIDAFNDITRDIHSEVAVNVFGSEFARLEKKSKAWTDLRNLAKRVVYARNYRAQPKTICENLKQDPQTPMSIRARLTPAYIEKISNNFDKTYPEIGRYCEAEWDKANRTGVQEILPLNRKWFHSVLPVEPTKAANIPIQFAAGDFHNVTTERVFNELKNRWPTADMVLTVHDQIVIECDDNDAESIAPFLESCFVHEVAGPAGSVMLGAEADIHRSWNHV